MKRLASGVRMENSLDIGYSHNENLLYLVLSSVLKSPGNNGFRDNFVLWENRGTLPQTGPDLRGAQGARAPGLPPTEGLPRNKTGQSSCHEHWVRHSTWDRLCCHYQWLCCGKIEKGVWPLNLDFVLDVITWRYYMRDPYTDNNLIYYYTQNYIQFCYLLVTRPAF